METQAQSEAARIPITRNSIGESDRISLSQLPIGKNIILDFQGEQSELTQLLKSSEEIGVLVSFRREEGKIGVSSYEMFQGYVFTRYPKDYHFMTQDEKDYSVIDNEMKGVGL